MSELVFPLWFKRQFAGPIDIDFVFDTIAEKNAYLASPRRYAGQVVTCKEEQGKLFVLSTDTLSWIEFGNSSSLSGDFVSISGDIMTGDLEVPNLLVNNDATINGNLYVNGTEFIVNTETVLISSNVITINNGEIFAGVSSITAGIEVDRGTLPNYYFIFDEASDSFKIGVAGELQKVATREDDPLDGGYAKWNSSEFRFDTVAASAVADDISSYLDLDDKTTISGGEGIFVARIGDHFDISVIDYISKTEVASISSSLQNQIDNLPVILAGKVDCVIGTKTYTITHSEVDVNNTYPFVSLSVPNDGSSIFVQGIYNRTTTSFQVVLSLAPVVADYSINWSVITHESFGGSECECLTKSDIADLSGSSLYGTEDITLNTKIVTISHKPVTINTTSPLTTLGVPTSSSALYIQAVTNRTTTSFDVVLSEETETTGYKIYWSLGDQEPKLYYVNTHINEYVTNVNDISGSVKIVGGAGIGIGNSGDTITISVTGDFGGGGSGVVFQGKIDCDTINKTYTINHSEISSLNTAFPQVSLSIPTSGDAIYVHGITNRTLNSFQVTLSEVPDTNGYEIYWIINDSDTSNSYVVRDYEVGTFNISGNFTPNANDYETYDLSIVNNVIIEPPVSMLNGQSITMKINGNGTNQVTFNSSYRFVQIITSTIPSNESTMVTVKKINNKYYASVLEGFSEI